MVEIQLKHVLTRTSSAAMFPARTGVSAAVHSPSRSELRGQQLLNLRLATCSTSNAAQPLTCDVLDVQRSGGRAAVSRHCNGREIRSHPRTQQTVRQRWLYVGAAYRARDRAAVRDRSMGRVVSGILRRRTGARGAAKVLRGPAAASTTR
jgi:hypothetical protein